MKQKTINVIDEEAQQSLPIFQYIFGSKQNYYLVFGLFIPIQIKTSNLFFLKDEKTFTMSIMNSIKSLLQFVVDEFAFIRSFYSHLRNSEENNT